MEKVAEKEAAQEENLVLRGSSSFSEHLSGC